MVSRAMRAEWCGNSRVVKDEKSWVTGRVDRNRLESVPAQACGVLDGVRDSAGPREKKRVQSKRLKATLLTPVVAARFAGFAAHAADRQRPRARRRRLAQTPRCCRF